MFCIDFNLFLIYLRVIIHDRICTEIAYLPVTDIDQIIYDK